MMQLQPISLVCVAAPADSALLEQWEKHLLPLIHVRKVTVWSEHDLLAGADRREELLVHVEQADCVMLLLSVDFFADEECLLLMQHALQRRQEGKVAIIPLLVRPVVWEDSQLATLPCLPANSVPIMRWEHPDEGWRQAVIGLQRLLGLPLRISLSPALKGAAADRVRMLHLLHLTYQTLLEGSLQGIAWMELNLSEHPDAVQNATHLLQRLPDRSEHLLPAGTRMFSVYDQAEGELLILGTPGSGKSTLLLDLALNLVVRAEADVMFPLPVILPLSSWAVNKPLLADWLVEQLARIYDVPRKLGQQWVEQGQVLPLLDGLDEMEEEARPQCIEAINTYHAERLNPLVVCSRRAEYDVASTRQRLFLQNAVVVQPLTQQQAVDIISACGPELVTLHRTFVESASVRELATTPLMLSVLILAYHGTTIGDLPQEQAALEERIWTDYVERMVRQKGADRKTRTRLPEKRYLLAQTRSFLSWLAQQMRIHNQALFYGEYLQESWLPATQQRTAKWLARWLLVRLPVMLLGTLTSILLQFFFLGLIDPTFFCLMGFLGGFAGWCLSQNQQDAPVPAPPQQPRWEHIRKVHLPRLLSAILLGVLAAASFGIALSSNVGAWLQAGGIMGICLGLSAWLFQARLAHIMSSPDRTPTRSTSGWSRLLGWIQTRSGLQAIWAGIILGIGFGLGNGGQYLSGGPTAALTNGLTYVLDVGLNIGVTVFLVSRILTAQTGIIHLAESIHWTGRTLVQRQHLRTSLNIVLAYLCVALSDGLINGLIPGLGLVNGLLDGLIWGPSVGLGLGLGYWLLMGLYQGVTQEHLPDQDRRQFNQGLHRSLLNGMFLSLLSAGIITVIIVLALGMRYGLNIVLLEWINGPSQVKFVLNSVVPFGWSDVWGAVWLIVLCGWLVVWAATGGLTILHHYLLRLLLARSQTFPWKARRFLDDATARVLLRRVGGGYGFVHRRLLDYFATSTLSRDALSPTSLPQQQTNTHTSSSAKRIPDAVLMFLAIVITALPLILITGIGSLQNSATLRALANATATAAAYPSYFPGKGTLAYSDPLTQPDSRWNNSFNRSFGGEAQFYKGIYYIVQSRTNATYYSSSKGDFRNFAFEVQMIIVKGDCGGIIFRNNSVQGSNYFFEVCQSGGYALLRYPNSSGKNVKILRNNSSRAIHTGYDNTNVIAVVANGSSLDLYVNRQKIDHVNDTTYSHGSFGLCAVAIKNPTEVAYGNAMVWNL